MSISENIKKIRSRYNLSQKDLASIAGVSDKAVSTWENGVKEPRMGTIQKIADHFGLQKSNIIEDDGLDYSFTVTDSKTDNPCRPYPVIGEVAAGFGSEAIEEETGDYEQIPLEWLRGHNPDNFFVLRVKGDSMYPDFQDGDHVLVHRQNSVDSGTVAVMLYDSEVATLKKVRYKSGEDWVELIPRNPEYQTKRIENWDLNECRVLGEVRRLIRDIK